MTVYTLLLAAGVFLALTAVQEHAALDEPVHWGTYRETLWECTLGREGRTCTSTGTWTSDDGGTVAHDVEFDGFDDDDGAHPGDAVRAGYRTFDADDDGLPATVWDEEGIDQTWIPPAVLALGFPAFAVVLAGQWGDLQRLAERWRRRSHR
ncbi:hypothetical protein [Curtobacterium sp. MCBD17_003]|uniref:hypothetical protein n=1 Tax=Curtobacterium sp. MCBD17_003 TaxID=2175667 RepID=UPI000DA9E4E7|nr:hypothetical protein [Curtobacterium sp. MCBD17_003]WIE56104.1 hypothetical protein DEI88_007910 [Curtobacterium sp. MCBD17_003]